MPQIGAIIAAEKTQYLLQLFKLCCAGILVLFISFTFSNGTKCFKSTRSLIWLISKSHSAYTLLVLTDKCKLVGVIFLVCAIRMFQNQMLKKFFVLDLIQQSVKR